VPQRFSRALDEASALLEPKAVRVVLPGATIRNATELDQWLSAARQQVEKQLKDGPVIL
jgi:superfamily II RNA helicase